MTRDFFISYTGADRDAAEWIGQVLEGAGYKVFLQAWDIRPGMNFVVEMHKGLQDCERMITVFSPKYLAQSPYGEAEWSAFFASKPNSLVPVRVKECDPTGLLTPIVYIDVFDWPKPGTSDRLLAGVNPGRQKPARLPDESRRIWHVPHDRNRHFTGREELLIALHQSLHAGNVTAVTALAGLGGVGKTQLSIEYAYRYRSEYEVVWWVRSELPTDLASDYAQLATKLNLPGLDPSNQPAKIEAVRDWLSNNSGWLLIFDNLRGPEDCEGYRPHSNHGYMILTSRNQNFGRIAKCLEIRKLPRAEAIAFVQKRSGRKEEVWADTLCQSLADLPLALEQAAAYIENTGESIHGYCDLLKTNAKDLLEPVAATFELSFAKLQSEHPSALELLNTMAFLAPDDVPRDLVQSTAPSVLEFNERVKSLRRYSLVDTRDGMLGMHRLLQQITRDRLGPREQRRFAEVAVKLVNDAFPHDIGDYHTWSVCRKLLPHALMASRFSEDLAVAIEQTSRLLNQAGLYQKQMGELRNAEELYLRALALGETHFGPDHPTIAIRANNLGLLLMALGDLDAALLHAKRALAIDEKFYGANHQEVATDAINVAQILNAQGDFDGALLHAKRALEIGKKVYGSDHPQVAIYARNLGQILRKQGELEDALIQTKRALAIDEEFYGSDHPSVARDANNLGLILLDKDDLQGALPWLERALRILLATYGPQHPDTKTVSDNLRILKETIADRDTPPRTL